MPRRRISENDDMVGLGATFDARNSYTHSCILLLASRHSKDELTPEYRDDEKISAVDSFLIATALFVTYVFGSQPQ